MQLDKIKEEVKALSKQKTDIVTSLNCLSPDLKENVISLSTRSKLRNMTCTKRGQTSYLKLLEIPRNFFYKCNQDLQRDIIREFHAKFADRNVILRLINNEIRFVASERYKPFNDVDVIDSIGDLTNDVVVRDFFQNNDFFKLRLTLTDPIKPCEEKVFYPGVQVLNSETGLSSVRVDFFIYEEVCTNGMIVPFADLPSFKMKHSGSPLGVSLEQSFSRIIGDLSELRSRSEKLLLKAQNTSGENLLNAFKQIKHDGKVIPLKRIEELAKNYQSSDKLMALDLLSGYTEAVKNFNIDERLKHESFAGKLLKHIAS